MKQNLQVKLAQLNMAMRHVLRIRTMNKQAGILGGKTQKEPNDVEERYKKIGDLLKQRDKGLLVDILEGVGKGGLTGFGIGGIAGGALASIPGMDEGAKAGLIYGPLAQIGLTGAITGGGALLGGAGVLPIGATIGGLHRLLTHGSRKQKAINRLKELGIESNE